MKQQPNKQSCKNYKHILTAERLKELGMAIGRQEELSVKKNEIHGRKRKKKVQSQKPLLVYASPVGQRRC